MSGSGDIRKDFIITTIANYFQEPPDKLRKLYLHEHLNDFLDAPRSVILCARRLPESEVILDTNISIEDEDDSIILFFKTAPDPITPENLHNNVHISTMVDSPVTSLYHSLSTVFMPALMKNSKWSQAFDSKTTNLMVSLEKTLANMVRHQSNFNSNENAISSLDNEEQLWQDAIGNAKTRDEANAAESILEIVKGINAELKSLTDWTSGSEVFENITVSLIDLWNMGEKRYSEIRILQILSAIGNTLVQNVQESLKSTNAFETPYHEFEKQINWGISIMTKTTHLCNKLTGDIWKNDGTRPFKGSKHIPHLVMSYSQRLTEIQRIRTVHRQLTLLLSTEEFSELKPENAFAPFANINPYLYNSYTEPLWQTAVTKFEKLIGPAEQAIANKLKARLSKDYQQFDLLAEFKRYMELIERPKVSAVLRPNRESLLLTFIKMTERFDEQLELRNFPSISGNSSEPINNIYHLKHMKAKLKEISEVSEKVLKDLPNYPTLLEKFQNASDGISSEEKRCFKDWSSELLQSLRRNEITLRKDDPVVEFVEGSRQMEVTYNGKLVQISEEAQQLLILGYRIPREVVDLVSEAKKFVRQAQQLDQIANFHNTIGDRMIPSQRPMMLDTAVALSKMVQDQNGIVWSNTAEVDKYIQGLKQLVTRMARQNNQLSCLHIQIKEKVMSLFETDLIKQQQKWKDILKQIKTIIKDVENQDYKNMKSWKNHWDRQLFKALEVQFLLSLSSINENLPEISAELVYRTGRLQFKPPLEELRQIYYGNIRKFLNIPLNFKGVSEEVPENEQIFPIIVKRHAHRFEKIYRDGETLFDRLLSVQGRFVEWIALGSADIETLSKKYLVNAEDWEKNFRVSKTKGQEIIRLNCSDEKIGCIVVSYKLLRLEIELLNRKYWEILVTLLNNAIIQDMVTVERFLQDGIEKLKEDPQSVEEITKANTTKEQLSLEAPNVKDMMDQVEKKNKTLVTWTKEKVDLNRVRVLWDNFQSLMENHQHIIGRQVENLKINLQGQARQVNNEMEHFKLRWDELKPVNSEATKNPQKFDDTILFINDMKEEWAKLMEKQKHIADSCENLHVDNVEFPYITDVDSDLQSISKTWEKLAEFRGDLKEFEEEDWIIFRAKPYRFEEFLQMWDEKFRAEPKSDLIIRMLRDIESYSALTTNLKFIRGDTFSEKHWYELYSLLEMPSKPLGQLKVKDFMQVKEVIGDKVKELKELNTRAAGEVIVQQALSELDGWEIEAKFSLIENQDSQNRTIPIIQDFKSVLNKLGDNQSLLQSIRTSPFYSNFADRISVWETRLADLDEYLQSLNKIQRRWVYLEPIFSHGVLETEQQRFRRIDEDFRLIMDKIKSDSRVVSLCKFPGIRNRLNMLLDQLARCQSSLNEFLERKRSGFPRFYFIGDDDLLEILGQSTKPAVIQAHLKKLFAGIYNVEFDSEEQFITAMKSLEGEVVGLKSKVKIMPNVEEWLSELSNEMKYTLKSSLLDCISDVKHHSRDLKLEKYPAQILCLGNSIVFTERCEDAIRSNRLQDYLSKLKDELHFYTNYNIKNGAEGEGQNVLELKLKDLILDIIHEMDVTEHLIEKRTSAVSDWGWQKQLRFYIRDDGSAVVKMADAEFLYSYEYQGNAQKLVHTPLTDKCYLTLTQGMRMGLGGNPYGPAGTGKTESVKALGGLMGRQVLVFNCDEGIDVKAMGRIFIGLSKCGAWGCFDEFNRLEGATLSAVSMQIQPIQTALKQASPNVVIMDELVPLDPNAGIFVTLNPAGKGYGGRNKLPDNLKQLFRPVVMSQPDNERIGEVILYTEGFKSAKKLGKKLVEVFRLSERLLTPQKHYDWGLRALKTVLKGCGAALKDFKGKNENSSVSEKEENDLVVSTLRLNTLPKLTHSDCFRFDNLIKDVFPNAVFKELGHQVLTDQVKEACAELELAVNENQVRKCLELYEQLQQRMGVVIVGPPSCGKSTVLTLLKHALIKSGQKIKTHIINPKAMPRTHLLGHINLDTRQWTDGVLTMKAQQVYSEPPDVTSWIICDGDIDPEWVESLNSVLDDNRLLTLPSGWRIKFGPNVNFIFETHDLSYASPATISRMGMIFMSDEDADVKGIVSMWLSQEPPEEQQMLAQIIEDHFYVGLKWIQQHEGQVALPTVSVVKNALSLMSGIKSVSHLAIAMIRGLGGHLSIQQAIEFSKEVFTWTQQTCPGLGRTINFYYNRAQDRIDVYQDDDMEQSQEFQFNQLPLVRTGNVKRVLDHISPWLQNQESFILIGPEGCGKSMILDAAFHELRSTEVATIHCSGLITPENVLQKLSQVCITMSTNSGRVYKSKDGERLILYFKGVNLVKPDKWGTCQLVEFLQQILSYDGFYDKNLEWVGIRGIQIVASITVGSSGGLYTLSPRFISRLRVCTMTQPEPDQLFTICNNYLSSLFQNCMSEHPITKRAEAIESIARGMVTVYKEVRNAFTPVQQSHYQFTPRDLTKWVLGLMRYDVQKNGEEGMKDLYNAWAFECCRIFRDKLVSPEEKTKFDETIVSPVLSQWSMPNVKSLFEESCWISGPACFIINSSVKTNYSPLFGNTLYKATLEELITIVGKGMVAFGRENRELNIVVIPELLNNVAYIDRILSFPCSSLVLAGRAGVGRRTALSVVSALQRATVLTLKVGRNYTIKSFKNDLKAAIQMSAVEGNKVFLVVEDFQLVDKVFLDMLNSLLSSGEIPGLYSPEELETIIATLRDQASADGYNSSLYAYFAFRVRHLMQIILIMDYTNENFIPNCQSNPAIYKQCSMIWLDNWTPRTLKMIPLSIIKKFYEKTDGDHTGFTNDETEKRQAFIGSFRAIFQSLPKEWTYPRRYVTLIHNYAMLYNQKRVKIVTQIERLKAGVAKLNEAKEIVEKLKADAAVQEETLAEKQDEANKALEMITITMKSANMQRGEMEELKKKTLQENEVLLEQKKSIDEELKEIEPLIQMAKSAVGSIKNEALTEIRSLRAPPDGIRDILEGVLRLMGIRDMSWNSMKTFLAKRGVKDDIRNFDARHIHPEDRDGVEKLLRFKQESFDPKYAKRASAAAAPLAEWVVANVKFSKVLEKIEPLERKQRTLEENLRLAESQMDEISSELMSVDERVQQLKGKLNQYTKEAAEIEFHLSKAKGTLLAAEGLVGKLDDEFGRWKVELQELDLELGDLPMNSLLAAAFITYLCDAPEDLRLEYLNKWGEALQMRSFDFCKFLSSERDLLQWQSLGLPSDRLSQENAIMIFQLSDGNVTTCSRPFLIDPSSRATEWLKNFLSLKRPPTVISLQHPNFQNELELAVRFGKILVVLEADIIEPILVPILRGDLVAQGSREVVQIADKTVDYNPDFRLFLCTRTPNPIINPDAAAVLTVVNFTTTRAGLTSQLLSTTLSFEKPEIETKKKDLVKNIETLKIELSKLGESLLQELASAQGNILENKELLESLNKTKVNSVAITESLSESSQLEEALNNEINDYLPFAEYGSCLYFAIIDSSKLNNMYQFSLNAFAGLFERALKQSVANGDLTTHINHLKSALESLVYEYVCRSLFKSDRLAFAIHLGHAMHPEYFQENEWEAFTGQLVTDLKGGSSTKDIVPSWIDEDRSFPVYLLSSAFPTFYEALSLPNQSLWEEFYSSTECEEHIPQSVREQISNFQKMMLIQTLRPDRLHTVMSDFARAVLGRKTLFPPPTNLRQIVKETMATEPILILVSAGADPSNEMRELAHNAVGSQRYIEISMGQGQIDMALEKLKQGAQVGHWICMKNLHLVTHWLDTLEKEIKALTPHESFRLWLTSEPHPSFPKILLQTCLKVAYEAPPGLKKNLQRTYGGWTPQYVVGDKNIVRTQALFVLALFHAVVQERRTYIPQGWSKFYEFNESDLRAGADVLDQLFKGNRSREIQWPYVHGLFEQAIFGGRIDNDYDLRVLISYLGEYFNESILTGANPSRRAVGPAIKLPNTTDIQEYYRLIESMPEYDKPSSFGLPSNIERSWQRIVSSQVIGQLKTLSRRFSDTVKFDKALWHQELTPLLNLWKKLNQGQGTMGMLQEKLLQPDANDNDSGADPIEAFVKLEYYNVVSLMQTVHKTLGTMSKVIRGILVPTDVLVVVADSLLIRETPAEWLKKWEGPMDAMSYLQGVVTRAIAIQKWKNRSKEGSILRNPVDLSDLMNPDMFLSAFKQYCARKLGVAMDELVFVCGWDRNTVSAGKLSCQITGLLLEGCSFNGVKLVENTPESAPIVRVGDCTIAWMSPKDSQTQNKSETLSVPLYYNETRQQLITSLEFTAQSDSSKWIQAGVALFLKN